MSETIFLFKKKKKKFHINNETIRMEVVLRWPKKTVCVMVSSADSDWLCSRSLEVRSQAQLCRWSSAVVVVVTDSAL